jgi:WS/DGAT/MGAT family acyltransferase
MQIMSRIRLNNVDLAWLRLDHPNNPMMITVVMQFQSPVDYDRLVALIRDSLARYRRFHQRIVRPGKMFSRPYWEDAPNHRVENHIERLDLPQPAGESDLMDLVNQKMNTPLDFALPLWHVTVVNRVAEGSALIVRIHHCIADGISLMQVLLRMTTTAPDGPVSQMAAADAGRAGLQTNPAPAVAQPMPLASQRSEAPPTLTQVTPNKAAANAGGSVLIRKPNALDILAAVGRIVLRRPDPPTILKGQLGKAKKAVWSKPYNLAEVKKIAKFKQATVNDVLMAVATGAFRRYCELHKQLPKRNIRSFIMVNLRGREFDDDLGNKFGLVFLTLPMDRPQPQESLEQVKQGMDLLKASAEYAATYLILNVLGMVPGWVEREAAKIFDSKGTVVSTNVPGPRHVIYLAGAPVCAIKAWVPQTGRIGVGLSILSYNNQVAVGINVDLKVIPDPDVMLALFDEELAAFFALLPAEATD